MKIQRKIKKILKELRFYAILLIAAILFATALRVFIFTSIIKIPSASMDPAVLAGDYIIANKQIPGPRFYRDIRNFRIDGKVQTKRLNGIRKVRRNDILVFNFPYSGNWDKIDMDLNVYYLKRCVALPGDTFSIENGIYRVKNCQDSLGCIFRQRELAQKSQTDFPDVIWKCFPFDTVHYQWNIKDFGPFYIPASGATLSLDTLNCSLYKNLIEYETGKKLSVQDGSVFLDDGQINNYTFKLNYYFMAGDYIHDSRDSRYWGLLPEDCIIGKAVIIWKSKDMETGEYRWRRFFRIL
ncbi:MAG: signal peptidase I [Tannerella sp.]|jgi:signal peptidase I|nr:signal peptidase I [Tannerella sp.]